MKKILTSAKILILSIFLVTGCSEDGLSPSGNSSSEAGGGSSGQGGSLARFTIAKNYLYIVTEGALYTYSLANNAAPKYIGSSTENTTVETIYAMNDNLFLGTQNGVIIYSIANPSSPQKLSTYSHITSCDPVVARGDYAYSTLRTTSRCNRGTNRLDVINISNINSPFMETSLSMTNPKGLGLHNNFLYVCDDSQIIVYNILNPKQPVWTKSINLPGATDIIVKENTIIASSGVGVAQYEIGDNGDLTHLSTISVE